MKNFFLKGTDESMKRLSGFIVVIASTIVICLFKQEFVVELFYGGVILITGGIADSLINKMK